MKKNLYLKRSQRIRKKLKKVNSERYRLTIFRSLKNISAQIIDDKNNKTLVAATSVKKDSKQKKRDSSVNVAEQLVKKALEKKINKVYFDRGGYKYHGRIKTFADALRKGGLTF
tara:strand:- start:49 stop:390 length:342 start_codon:yes stop_codon:yes gene_type:complete